MRWKARRRRLFSMCIGSILLLMWLKSYALDNNEPKRTINIILIGATGDLAKKYLWQGFFNLFLNDIHSSAYHMKIYGATRVAYSEAHQEMTKIVREHVKCDEDMSDKCKELRLDFQSRAEYVQLKSVEDYTTLCNNLSLSAVTGVEEIGRLFYLSVPPLAYATIVENINKVCRPTNSETWLKVVLEKPFGHDLLSAQQLATQISQHLKEDEIYRIDHYLGKPGVRSILPFRIHNMEILNPVWNHEHIEYVEVAMKETLDVKGRINFYDNYGIIRDVMQNHLTEIMSLVAMDIPETVSHESLHHSKLQLLKKVLPVRASQTVIGQYETYIKEWMEELSQSVGNVSRTPTFGASALFINNERWRGVPFILMSGKKLKEKLSYIKIVFKDVAVCPTSVSWQEKSDCEPKQIIFILSQTGKHIPHILVSKQFPKPRSPDSVLETSIQHGEEFQVFGRALSNYHIFTTYNDEDAYTSLIRDCYHGDRSNFVGTDHLMASWVIWNSVLLDLRGRNPRIYSEHHSEEGWLNFEVRGHKLKFTEVEDHSTPESYSSSSLMSSLSILSDSFRTQQLHSGTAEAVIALLAKRITQIAIASIKERGSFHVAFSGGTTPKALFAFLAAESRKDIPWDKTHLWMVDERCVTSTDHRSNFNSLQESLLEHINIPHFNVHPMPTELINGLCSEDDKGPQIYSSEMSRVLVSDRLDYILLGTGTDGHIASLFPNSTALNETYHRVIVTGDGPRQQVRYRMTMTYYTINNARNIGVLVIGDEKKDIINLIKEKDKSQYTRYPILGVYPINGTMEWFMDDQALSYT